MIDNISPREIQLSKTFYSDDQAPFLTLIVSVADSNEMTLLLILQISPFLDGDVPQTVCCQLFQSGISFAASRRPFILFVLLSILCCLVLSLFGALRGLCFVTGPFFGYLHCYEPGIMRKE